MTRVLARIEKLLRLADSSANPNTHERTAAALQIVDLILEHRLVIEQRPKASAPSPQITRSPIDIAPLATELRRWRPTTAARDAQCESCGELIQRGEPIYSRFNVFSTIYRHEHCL